MNLKPTKLSLAIVVLSTTSVFSVTAQSQPAELGELIVTAKGYESDTLETPSATEKLDAKKAAASQTAGDLFRGKAGLAVQGDGSAWGGNPVIRGLMDSVEVVKGPGSVLQGTGALGAAAKDVDDYETPDGKVQNSG